MNSGSGIFFQNFTFFVSVTLSGLVRISQNEVYRWKDLSLRTLLLTNLLTSTESYMGQGKIVYIVPYGDVYDLSLPCCCHETFTITGVKIKALKKLKMA